MTRSCMVFYSALDDFDAWRTALEPEGIELCRSEDITDADSVRSALVWKPPQGFFQDFPKLELVVNLGAGVDALVGRDDLPDVPITRLSDPRMARMMAGFVLFAVTRYARNIPQFEKAQRDRRWHYIHPKDPDSITVGVLGLGELGLEAARECSRHGYRVLGWSRTRKDVEGVSCSSGADALVSVLSRSDIVVCMLPKTPDTDNLLDAAMFRSMKQGAFFINVSRGSVVDEPALIEALASGWLGGATLDVFAKEPLAEDSPLWAMENVLITPHLASIALPSSAARQIGENVRRIARREPVLSRIDPQRGY
ncbi:glyoxylate/hydroxypyruvate reductase A [Phyllobacterium sp. 0TCS1.6C]|uniref:2-hydroxyacid dehydrogenase n=1 Tax=unclassified Phyllobacterium TaxID=2638441 RepID=UPI0022655C96|nr:MULTISPECIES: glyoxylate/hydroxypyruvate reductase A [unclassified Phyllobacterium]MCX8279721.1 glyoxylate/hydroxypyruvate reductase A [Phyllobacterium sp. 0TCS1.6C]MCX8295675.1 glyoxylate/hydroxypyruvate reductase A [Phyllobacterium sp. 0TCS1.6A]